MRASRLTAAAPPAALLLLLATAAGTSASAAAAGASAATGSRACGPNPGGCVGEDAEQPYDGHDIAAHLDGAGGGEIFISACKDLDRSQLIRNPRLQLPSG